MKEIPFELKLGYVLAIVLMVTLVVFMIFIVVLYSRRQTVLQNERKLKEVEYLNLLLQKELEYQKIAIKERERISHDMHDDFGAVISALKLQINFLKHKIKDKETGKNIHELLETCDELNISMREMLWSLNSENDSLFNLIEYISNYAENFFSKTDIKVHFNNSSTLDMLISSEVRRNLFLCVKEGLNNVYKHGQAKNVYLHFNQTDKEFSIDVIDDGIGIKQSRKDGNGFSNMHCRMTSLNGIFKTRSVEKGAHLNFIMPLLSKS